MTRYARAKGSKASNEKLPNEATPWCVMKQQLEENLSKHKEHSERTKSAKELLGTKQDIISLKNTQNSWAEFGNNSETKNNFAVNKMKQKQNILMHRDKKNSTESSNKGEHNIKSQKKKCFKRNINEVEDSKAEVKNKKFKDYENQSDNKSRFKEQQGHEAKIETNVACKGTRKCKQNISQTKQDQNNISNDTYESLDEKDTLFKHQKHNMKQRKNLNKNVCTVSTNANNNNHCNTQNRDENENKQNYHATGKFHKNLAKNSRNFKSISTKFGTEKKQNRPKIRDDKEHKRRKPDLGPTKIMINGVEVEIVKFGGFPVKKEDADRLSDLKQKMVMKGIPKREIDVAMKLERRKAEKALARIKKCVCFHCRKAGHNLSDCPELGSEQIGTGICFKCGSTEHTHFECKVTNPTEFRYATCFICREQGHIAKQCPDNPKGVYPEGGSCKVCGDVTHLKKDCPDLIKGKEESAVTVNTITSDNLESLEGNEKNSIEKNYKKTKRAVKF